MPGRRPSPEVRQKRTQLLELMRAGVDPEVIAERLAYKNAKTVESIYWQEINKRHRRAADEAAAIQLDRIEALIQGSWNSARKGDDKSIASVSKLMDQEAKLRGLNKADQLEERKIDLADAALDLVAFAMQAILDAIGLTAEQEKRKAAVLKEQMSIVTGASFVSLADLIEVQEAENDRVLALTAGEQS